MPRGIVPVVALLIIASSFSQFGGTGLPATLGSGPMASQGSSASPKTSNSNARNRPQNNPSDYCKDLTPCIPRVDLGPWIASCAFIRAENVPDELSPVVVLNLGKPVSPDLPYIATKPNIMDPDASNDKGARDPWCLQRTQKTHPVIDTLIVTLPDPVNSHLALDFDRRIDAVDAAALEAGYFLDQYWLPWEGADLPLPEDPEKASRERVLRRVRQNEPGLQIFRAGTSTNSHPLFVFLVGETPTLGVNLPQLENAIKYVGQIRNALPPDPAHSRIKILGPAFSGSVPTLGKAFLRLQDEAHPFEIIPSSATGYQLRCELSTALGPPNSVQSVLHDDDAALERFLNYADKVLKIPPGDVAILSESETAYGSTVVSSNIPGSLANPTHPEQKCAAPDHGTVGLTFPRDIYQLRAAYPDQQHLSAGSSRSEGLPSSGLTLNLKSFYGAEDDIPPFSRAQLPLSEEALMLSVSETIHRRKIKMVGIVATDVFDTLFVMRFLQEFSPDVRLFVLDSDLLFVRAADSLSLQGTLAITNYPLSSSLQALQGEEKKIRTFPSRNAEATYNAFLALIGNTEKMRDYTQENEAAREPRLWLTAISRNGFQPVHLLERAPGEAVGLPFVDHPKVLSLGAHTDPPSGGYLFLCALLIGVTGTQLALAGRGLMPKLKFLGWANEFFHICRNSAVRVQKTYLLATSLLMLAAINFMVFLPIWGMTRFAPVWDLTSLWYLSLSILGIAAVTLSFLAAAVLSLITALWLFLSPEVRRNKEAICLAMAWIVAGCYFVIWYKFAAGGTYDSRFFVLRSLDLSNGTSPLLPHLLLFVAFYSWSLTNLRRVHLWESRRQILCLPSLNSPYESHFEILENDLDSQFKHMLFSRNSWIILALVLLSLVLLRPFSHVAGFEPFSPKVPQLFDYLYGAYLLLCMTFLTHSLLRFIVGWAALQKILRRLERQPIRHAFDRLPKKFYSWTPVWHSGGSRRTFALQTRALECLRKLRSYDDAAPLTNLHTQIQQYTAQLQAETTNLLMDEADGCLDLKARNEACQKTMSEAADYIAKELLIDHWLKIGACESLDHHEKKESEKSDSGVRYLRCDQPPPGNDVYIVAEEFVALRFVAFMRYIGVQLRNILSFVAAGFILCVASVRSYPFLSQRTIGWTLTLIFIALSVPVVIIFAQMDKDAILSRLSDTEPGKLDRSFYARVFSYGALPLLTVLASQFPAIGRFLFSWVQPAIEALH